MNQDADTKNEIWEMVSKKKNLETRHLEATAGLYKYV